MNNSFYNDFAARFAAGTLTSLVESFNNQVGKRGFNSARAAYDQALIDELVRRGIDVSAVFNGTTICHLLLLYYIVLIDFMRCR